jgi:predicted helicase
MKTIHEVLQGLRDVSLDERDKGNHFESLTKRWLEISPEYADIFEKVWTYAEWAAENDLPKTDVGIDLVAREVATGDLCAIQCKFYDPGTSIDKRHIDSFFTALSKKHFSSGIIFSTSTKWSKHAEDALAETTKPVVRVGLHDLEDSGVDWDKFSLKNPGKLELKTKKTPYKHQELAINDVLKGFSSQDRGKLIMACGTGKTFTSLKIAEAMVPDGGTMLFLVPSIALLSQSLKEWKQEAERPITAYAVCSDSKVGKSKDDEDIQVTDLAYPATTNAKKLIAHFNNSKPGGNGFTVIFSTYQSIDVVSKAQALGVPEFDLIVCDEAHRTTGVKLADADESSFIRVHDNKFVEARKRLYMTATPRIYAEQSKQKALESDSTLASMDDESYYGAEFHRLNFGKAVSEGLLSDYKVLVLAVSEDHVSRQLQKLLTKDGELNLDDATKIVGCYNGLLKRSSNPEDFVVDQSPMQSAVAFSRSIKDSKRLASLFEMVTSELNKNELPGQTLTAEADHVDGTYNMEARIEKLDWLKEKTSKTVRILSNARCLSEGVDVPALDAVLFLNPRDSQVDVVQSVGRVMRKSPGKQYGYVILPITVPAGKTAEEALADNNKYKVVWQVLQALRAHDERFDAMVNKIDLAGKTDERLRVIGVGENSNLDDQNSHGTKDSSIELDFPLGEWKDAILAKIVQKVGQKGYWENWARDVAEIAQDHVARITYLLESPASDLREEFQAFLGGLQDNINPHLTDTEAIEMLSQHLITKPVFDALFQSYAFTDMNPVSQVMQRMLDALDNAPFNDEKPRLESFYESVRIRASGIDDAAGKQKVIKELYEKFFKIAFARDSERLGIVYTPNEIVDFMLRMSDGILEKHFSRSLSDEGVSILDPFTGTGTFLVRLIQNSLIKDSDLVRKFRHELHANEIVLLAYYVAAVNIEEALHNRTGKDYLPFNGVVLTDTFQMYERGDRDEIGGREVFAENNSRVVRQKTQKITLVIGNPPYSAGQLSSNDNNANVKYQTLDDRISETFGSLSTTRAKNTLYDSYIRAIRWAMDRVKSGGIVSFITNNGYLDSNTAEGIRKSLVAESTQLYVLNLRGNSRSMEIAKKEGGNVFDIRVGVAVLFFVNQPGAPQSPEVKYFEMPDYSTRSEKLKQLEEWNTFQDVPWQEISPNSQGDWLNQRSSNPGKSIPLADSTKKGGEPRAIFRISSSGAISHRDAWVFNFDKELLEKNVKTMINFYNSEVERLASQADKKTLASRDPLRISWSHNLWKSLEKGKKGDYKPDSVRTAVYRPFVKTNFYSDKFLSHSLYRLESIFPTQASNFGILTTGVGMKGRFRAMAIDAMPESQTLFNDVLYPRYFYPKLDDSGTALFAASPEPVSAISEFARKQFSANYGRQVSDDEIFFYVFGVLSHPKFIDTYNANLTREIPGIPFLKNFDEITDVGRRLFQTQINVDSSSPFSGTLTWTEGSAKKDNWIPEKPKLVEEGSGLTLVYSQKLSVSGIPKTVLDVKFGTKSPIEWVLDRIGTSIEKNSQIENRGTDFFTNPEEAFEYVLKVISTSIAIVELENELVNVPLD